MHFLNCLILTVCVELTAKSGVDKLTDIVIHFGVNVICLESAFVDALSKFA
jgi:hypothetical protein